MTYLAVAWSWVVANVNALADEPAHWEPVPKSVFATSPMWWGELLEPPAEAGGSTPAE